MSTKPYPMENNKHTGTSSARRSCRLLEILLRRNYFLNTSYTFLYKFHLQSHTVLQYVCVCIYSHMIHVHPSVCLTSETTK